ncbi:MAG TPA: sulfur oxidation c-type cytochrome SoxX [Burkholderiales bacterium]|nr:sulfur oxidation c-type cytochrome SoxX [Burkholderiales bacterium]
MNLTLLSGLFILAPVLGNACLASADQPGRIAAGARLAHEVAKGNCLACHAMPSDPAAVTSANIGPPLVAIRARFPDREQLRRKVWDAGLSNPDTVMPPFGKQQILTSEEIDLIVEYLYTL